MVNPDSEPNCFLTFISFFCSFIVPFGLNFHVAIPMGCNTLVWVPRQNHFTPHMHVYWYCFLAAVFLLTHLLLVDHFSYMFGFDVTIGERWIT